MKQKLRYLMYDIISAIIAGTVIREDTWYCSMAWRTNRDSNLGTMTWQAPAISIAMLEDIPPMWHNGAVWRYTYNTHEKVFHNIELNQKKTLL